MADLFREVDEALREDRAKQIWQRYGTAIIVGALTIIALVAGYNYWQSQRLAAAQAETWALSEALAAMETDPGGALQRLAALGDEGDGTAAVLATLAEAGLHARRGDREQALLLYRRVAGDDSVERVWRDLARLMAVQHDLGSGDPAALEAELAPLLVDGGPWRFSARELAALLALRRNDVERARTLLQELAQDPEAPPGVSERAGELAAALEQ